MKLLSSLLICSFLRFSFSIPLNTSLSNDEFTHHATLDAKGDFKLSWKFDSDEITFQYSVASKGWAGLGFSPDGTMVGADLAVIAYDQSGKPYVSDRQKMDPPLEDGYPLEDKHQDVFLIDSKKDASRLTFTFHRKRNTGDAQDRLLTTDPTHVIFAKNDAVPEDRNKFEYHGPDNHGTTVIKFFDPPGQ